MSLAQTKHKSTRVLIWNVPESDSVNALIADALPDAIYEYAECQNSLTLRLLEARWDLAIIVVTDPFTAELRHVRRFLNQLASCPVLLIFVDIPESIVGFEREFSAVVQLNGDSGSARLQNAIEECRRIGSAMNDLHADRNLNVFNNIHSHLLTQERISEIRRLSLRGGITSIVGEYGTAKNVLMRLLFSTDDANLSVDQRGGIRAQQTSPENLVLGKTSVSKTVTEGARTTFYCHSDSLNQSHVQKLNSTIRNLLESQHVDLNEQSETNPRCQTIILHSPSVEQIEELAPLFVLPDHDQIQTHRLITISARPVTGRNHVQVNLQPLRSRPQRIPQFLAGILAIYQRTLELNSIAIDAEATQILFRHAWPANVCEFNLVIAGALADSLDNDRCIVIDPVQIQNQMAAIATEKNGSTISLRNRMRQICEQWEVRALGAATQMRSAMNDALLFNAESTWAAEIQFQSQARQRVEVPNQSMPSVNPNHIESIQTDEKQAEEIERGQKRAA